MMKQVICVNGEKGCSACGACLAVCPKQAISMCADEYGFLYPRIAADLCVDCGRCVQACSSSVGIPAAEPLKAYAAAGKNAKLVSSSASGGIFATIGQNVLNEGGKVAGAVLNLKDGKLEVCHLLSANAQDLHRMQGSKYVQSDAWKCYDAVIEAIRQGDTVLFSGTPCQVAAVKSITGNPKNLLTMDVVCHGVPSAAILQEYLTVLGKGFMGRIEGFTFRDKSCNKRFCARIDVRRGNHQRTYYLRSSYISFYKYFLESAIYRENCYSCPYACGSRVSDLTVGDYWGVDKIHGTQICSDEYKGHEHWSCLLINTEKGEQLIDQCSNALALIPSKLEWIARENQQLKAPSQKSEKRKYILNAFSHGGYAEVERGFRKESRGFLRLCWRAYKDIKRNERNKSPSKEEST